MTRVSAQISLYPLRRTSIGPVIRDALRTLEQHQLEVEVGEMSTTVRGDDDEVFAALQEAFQQATREGDTVMTVTVSNACPESA